jgi:hypothetical protein
MGRIKNVHSILIGKTEEKMPLERPRRSWKDSIHGGLKEIGCEGVDRIHLTQNKDW